MFLARKGLTSPKEFYHKPEIKNKYDDTVALLFSYKKMLPPKEWEHDPNIKNIEGHTVEDELIERRVPVPE